MSTGSSADFWVRATGDTEYVTSHQNEQYRKKLLAEVKQATNLMITTSVDQSTPLTDQNEGVNPFCFQLEAIIVHGLQGDKKKSNYARDFISFWDYIQYVSRHAPKELKKILKTVEKLPDVHTNDGKGRAWVRAILNQNLVVSAFEMLINEKHKETWYAKYALLSSHEEWSMLLSLLSALEFIEFDLKLNESNLDIRIQHEQPGVAGRYPQAMLTKSSSGPTGRKKRRRKKSKATNIAVIGEAKSSNVKSILNSQDNCDYKAMLAEIVYTEPTQDPNSEGYDRLRAQEIKEEKEREQALRVQAEQKQKETELQLQQEREEARKKQEIRLKEEAKQREQELREKETQLKAEREKETQNLALQLQQQQAKKIKEQDREMAKQVQELEQKQRKEAEKLQREESAQFATKKQEDITPAAKKLEEQKQEQMIREQEVKNIKQEQMYKEQEAENIKQENYAKLKQKKQQTILDENVEQEKFEVEEEKPKNKANTASTTNIASSSLVIGDMESQSEEKNMKENLIKKKELSVLSKSLGLSLQEEEYCSSDNDYLMDLDSPLDSYEKNSPRYSNSGSNISVSDDDEDSGDLFDEDMERLLAEANSMFTKEVHEEKQPIESPQDKPTETKQEEHKTKETAASNSIAEDEDLQKALESLNSSSFVDKIDVDTLIEDSPYSSRLRNIATAEKDENEETEILRIRGDPLNFFLLTVAEDKTPLAAPALSDNTVHVITPLYNQSKEPPLYEEPVSKGSIIETQSRGVVLDISPRGLSLPIQGNSWQVVRNQIPLQVMPKKPANEGARCPNCKTQLSLGLIFSSARYCNFYGTYFCSDCHVNDSIVVPAFVVQKWDFTAHKVSICAMKFLEKLYDEPIYNIAQINPFLYDSIAPLKQIKHLRQQLFFTKDYLLTCNREKVNIIRTVDASRRHLMYDRQLYSMRDLTETYAGKLARTLHELAERCVNHVKNCPLCGNKGYICQFCCSREYIFPFQLKIVTQCKGCDNFFHRQCYSRDECPTCNQRLLNHTKAYS